jgi:hypothetical protein
VDTLTKFSKILKKYKLLIRRLLLTIANLFTSSIILNLSKDFKTLYSILAVYN